MKPPAQFNPSYYLVKHCLAWEMIRKLIALGSPS